MQRYCPSEEAFRQRIVDQIYFKMPGKPNLSLDEASAVDDLVCKAPDSHSRSKEGGSLVVM